MRPGLHQYGVPVYSDGRIFRWLRPRHAARMQAALAAPTVQKAMADKLLVKTWRVDDAWLEHEPLDLKGHWSQSDRRLAVAVFGALQECLRPDGLAPTDPRRENFGWLDGTPVFLDFDNIRPSGWHTERHDNVTCSKLLGEPVPRFALLRDYIGLAAMSTPVLSQGWQLGQRLKRAWRLRHAT